MAINKDEMKNKLAGAWSKTVDFSKKAAADIQKGAKDLSDKTKEEMYAYRMKKYNPLYKEEFESDEFKFPSIIRIARDSENVDIDVCDGAIGWRDNFDGVQVLHIYSKYVDLSGLQFVPFARDDKIYCVDQIHADKFIEYKDVFTQTADEKVAELVNVAVCLGAKSCSVEVCDADGAQSSQQAEVKMSVIKASQKTGRKTSSMGKGKNVMNLTPHDNPRRPELHWFAHNNNINRLIDMRCNDLKSVQYQCFELHGSAMESMSRKTAIAIDKLANLKGSASMESQSTKEHNSVLIFEVEF